MVETLKIGQRYSTSYGTLWKDGTYFPRGTEVTVVAYISTKDSACAFLPRKMANRSKPGKTGAKQIS